MSTTYTSPAERAAHHEAARKPVTRKLSEVASDLATLAELQGQLFVVDAKEASHKIVPSVGLLVGGLILGLGSVPILLAAVALTLHEAFELSFAVSFWITTGLGIVLSGVLAFVGQNLLRTSLEPFKRSQFELMRNLRWVKYILQHNRS